MLRVAFALALTLASSHLWGQTEIKRLPVPAESALAEATKLVAEVYRKDYADAKTPAQKQALAKKLLADGEGTTDDPTARYALIELARKIAGNLADVDLAFKAIDAQARKFEIDVLAAKLQVVSDLASSVKDPGRCYDLLCVIHDLMDEALVAQSSEQVRELQSLLMKVGARIADPVLRKQIEGRNAEVDEILAQVPKYKAAQAVLASQPADAAANHDAGTYWLLLGKWDKALPFLALSSEAAMQKLAELELQGGSPANEAQALVEGWWELAKSAQGWRKAQYQSRALQHIKARWTAYSPLTRTKFARYIQEFLEENKHSIIRWQAYRLEYATPAPWHVRLNAPRGQSLQGSISPISDHEGMLDITLVARTDSTNIRVDAYGKAMVIFNWEVRPDELRVHRPDGSMAGHKFTPLQVGRFYTLRWIYEPTAMRVLVNGAIVCRERWQDQLPPNRVRVYTMESTVDVRSLSILPVMK